MASSRIETETHSQGAGIHEAAFIVHGRLLDMSSLPVLSEPAPQFASCGHYHQMRDPASRITAII
jgi:hypothetical protein